jgi:GNAT superfamily N-acetyltransferase
VHPAFSRKGIATLLFQQLKSEIERAAPTIRTEASEGSRPFFEKQGFQIMEWQEFPVMPDHIVIHNYKMTLHV